ncbi:EI24 domain-containing protein [Massilia sp. Dwa41.01b]|uniref:EI24 domain-containing protein n=1 Tax=unclassified Massilia TaxID=2609279 RepID=UPI0015FF17E5|nr:MULTISPECIES: EI24 domain-containing protein [unclassified Massilia]QNA88153.1 EI24 domain-containing protein [Massilia sp. Dwa41.01b]QNA99059.1 EI24 domain-containing protein [Massilia sp. Se16.2.3]
MNAVATAWARALRAQFSSRMLLLSLLPLMLSLLLWGGLLYAFGQPLFDWLQGLFAEYGWFTSSDSILSTLGLGMLKVMVVPIMAILLLLPLMIASSLLFMGVVAMPAIEGHVSRRQYPKLERKEGGSFVGSVAINLSSVLVFAALWLCTVPLYAVPPVAVLVQAALWGWVTSRVMSYDALAGHASTLERKALMAAHRWPLLAIGMVSGVLGALPGIAWMGGALLSMVLFPFLAVLSAWLYVLIFLFTGLWFQYYCLDALERLRGSGATAPMPA